jgi:hypothetical protein
MAHTQQHGVPSPFSMAIASHTLMRGKQQVMVGSCGSAYSSQVHDLQWAVGLLEVGKASLAGLGI